MSSSPNNPKTKVATSSFIDKIQPFIIGGASGCSATMVIQPLDMIKVRIQIKSEAVSKAKALGQPIANDSVSPFTIIKEIKQNGGFSAFYKGLDSALAR